MLSSQKQLFSHLVANSKNGIFNSSFSSAFGKRFFTMTQRKVKPQEEAILRNNLDKSDKPKNYPKAERSAENIKQGQKRIDLDKEEQGHTVKKLKDVVKEEKNIEKIGPEAIKNKAST